MADMSLFFMMTIVSVDIPVSIAAADLCVSPRASVLQYAGQPGVGGRSLLDYYIQCSRNTPHPRLAQYYGNISTQLTRAVNVAQRLQSDPLVVKVNNSKGSVSLVQTTLGNSVEELSSLLVDLRCGKIAENYASAVHTVCVQITEGLGLLTLTALSTALLLVFILLCITPVWKAISPLRYIPRPILKRDKYGVHLVTNSYQGPPGGSSESYRQLSSSIDVSYKSLEDPDEFEHVPLINNKRERPPSYRTILGSSEFMSVEEDQRRLTYHSSNEDS